MDAESMAQVPDRAKARTDVISFFSRLAAMAGLFWLMFGVVFGIAPMKNADMAPRISAGDLLLYYRLEQNYRAQDIVVFEKDGEPYTGRIVAREGDSVEITEHAELMINGSVIVEQEIYYSTPRYESEVTYPVVLGDEEYFVLCDYREGARDSRYFGAVGQEEIKGKVITVIRRSSL